MNRPWKVWVVFGVSLAILLAAMGWVSGTVLRLDRAQALGQQQADLEGKVRLALWRMDSMLAPIIAQESARPYFVYRAFYPAERAYNRYFNEAQPGETLVPSPLLTQNTTNVLLHFQLGPDGTLTSPQVPADRERGLAAAYTTTQAVKAARARLDQFQRLLDEPASPELAAALRVTPGQPTPGQRAGSSKVAQAAVKGAGTVLRNGGVLLALTPPPQPGANPDTMLAQSWVVNAPPPPPAESQQKLKPQVQTPAQQQAGFNQSELQARAQSLQQTFDLNVKNVLVNYVPPARTASAEGIFKPTWFGDTLVLARRVSVQGLEYLQGCWLDWPALRRSLLEGVKDLLPAAALEPLKANGTDPQARMLASLPLRLEPGSLPPRSSSSLSPIRLALVVAWAAMLLATVAVGVLLHGAVSLSERRGAFVSAVTHELRTPLTTFKMYSEMLADGMVPDPAKQRQYLGTLCSEANRLSHLVENVLAYARLERGSARGRVERLTLGQLVARVRPRLAERAAQAGMALTEDADAAARETVVHVDVAAVEQILFNLVDNACKYAAPSATQKVIHLEAFPENSRFAMLRVRDHGQGISAEGAARLFQPFSKSAQQAAHTAPGVGLGLALCRRLSRSMGGDLRLDTVVKDGACFILRLPVSAPGPATLG